MKKLKKLIEIDILKNLTNSSSSFLIRSNSIVSSTDLLDFVSVRSFNKVQAKKTDLSHFLNFSNLKFPLSILILDSSKNISLDSKNTDIIFAKVKTFVFTPKNFKFFKTLNSNFVLCNLISCLNQKTSLVRLLKIYLESKI
jgi:hypothetical protein